MIAVAILGVLAGILVLNFMKPTRKVKTGSEVGPVFAEFHRAQSQYALENGVYLSTGASADDIYPAYADLGEQAADASTPPDEWTTLRIQIEQPKLYCGYVAIAGTAADAIPTFAEDFGMTQPVGNWYVLYAKCNADGKTDVDAEYFASSVDSSTSKKNEGR